VKEAVIGGPAVIGRDGVMRKLPPQISDTERQQLERSARVLSSDAAREMTSWPK
jgi:malate/lactate dehydrogenase